MGTPRGTKSGARISVLEALKDELYGYQWSAILDEDTCNYCRSMDGKVIGVGDKAFHDYKPGDVHRGCRCMWVGIMKEEFNPPPITGIPTILRSQSEVPPQNFVDLVSPLPGSSTRDELRKLAGVK